MITRISYSERICARVYAMRGDAISEIQDRIQKEFRLHERPSRHTIARIIRREGKALVHHKRRAVNV